jgi:hypothetical protein
MPPPSTDFQIPSMFLFKLTSGKRLCISGYEVCKIDNDELIGESKGHFDSAEYERQLKGSD